MDVSETHPSEENIATVSSVMKMNRIVTIKRVRTANGEPVVYCIDQVLSKNYLPKELTNYMNESIFSMQLEESGEIQYRSSGSAY